MRPTPHSGYPYTRGDVASLAGVGVPTIKNLQAGKVLKKRKKGIGNWHGYSADDVLRIMVSKELLRAGVNVASIHSLFEAIEHPPSSGHPWAWLRTPDSRPRGAALVLILGHSLGPDPRHMAAGHVHLTTALEATVWLNSGRTVIVVDVGALIAQLEERTGRPYELLAADDPHDAPQ